MDKTKGAIVLALVKVTNLRKVYKTGELEYEALKGMNFEVEAGDMFMILGPSGSGKTTLLNCLSGIDDPTAGSILINNVDIAKLSDDEKTKFRAENMGFVFQAYNLIDVLTAKENVALPLLARGIPEKEANEKAIEVLRAHGLEHVVNKFPSQISGGERQRVAVSRALAGNPKIIWADEPTGALDTKTSFMVMDFMKELNEKNHQTFVIVTHDEKIVKYASAVLRIDSGQIVSFERIKKTKEPVFEEEKW
ncbi:ABC transporter ATP-binding protein [Mesoaciditoga lauensis]|uniref:ABC transporter ATP-binding protein n=1 Tax=Mesoaciditoga lauensis TaxID=1495039 RepID=UPI000B109DD4|nr:ABC transporter ATP-binding protein [Mesoaciditoga lauensis]